MSNRRTRNARITSSGLGYVAVGTIAGFLLAKVTQPKPQRVLYQCEEDQEFTVRSGATAILNLCKACDRLEPVLEPLGDGRIPPISAIRTAFF